MNKESDIQIGDVVRFNYGTSRMTGTIQEDRGPIGIKGRRLYLIDFSSEPGNPSRIELPAELFEKSPTWAVVKLGGRSPSIVQAHNVGDLIDNGGSGYDLTLRFTHPFENPLYDCQVLANREIAWRIMAKTNDEVRLLIEEPPPERVNIVCFEQ